MWVRSRSTAMNRFFLCICVSLLWSSAWGQSGIDLAEMDKSDPNSVIKASYLFAFAKHTDWPEDRKAGKFRIVIIDNPSTHTEMIERFSAVPLGGQEVEMIATSDLSAIGNAHIVFLNRTSAEELEKVVEACKNNSTLIVCQAENGLGRGADVNLIVKENKLRYQLNQEGAEAKDITFGSLLIQSAEK